MKYNKSDVLAAIVTYNPREVLIKNVESLSEQVGKIIIFDNHSNELSKKILMKLEKRFNCKIIFNETNEGIAIRLNEAVEFADINGYFLLLSMDQDTILNKKCVQAMIDVMNNDPKVASVGPARVSRKRNCRYYYKDYLITSGNLIQVSAIKKVGGYRDGLFIDMVDIDISLALRKARYKLAISNDARMVHKVGEKERSMLFGKQIEYMSHSAERFYYIYRNLLLINKIYLKFFCGFCLKLNISHLITFLHIAVESNSKAKFQKALQGIRDGIKA